MCWSCSWTRRLCLEEWRWGFSQKEHFVLGVPQPDICVHWWLLFLCDLGPSPGDGLLLHVWLAGRCSSSSPYSVSLLSHSDMSVCVCVHTHVHSCLSVTEPLTDSLIFDQGVMLMMMFLAVVYHFCEYFILLSSVVLKINFSYLMVSSVVGFYSSPLFTSILPRAKDTNLTQVSDS